MPDFSYTNTSAVIRDFLLGKLNSDHAAENYAYVMMQDKPHLDEMSVYVQANGAIRSATQGNFDGYLEVVRDEGGAVISLGGEAALTDPRPSTPIETDTNLLEAALTDPRPSTPIETDTNLLEDAEDSGIAGEPIWPDPDNITDITITSPYTGLPVRNPHWKFGSGTSATGISVIGPDAASLWDFDPSNTTDQFVFNFNTGKNVDNPFYEVPTDIGGTDLPINTPYQQFLEQANLLTPSYPSYADRYAESLYEPIGTAFNIHDRFGIALGATEGQDVEDWYRDRTKGFVSDPSSIYGGAAATLRGLIGLGGAGRTRMGVGFTPTWGEGGVTPADVGTRGAESIGQQLFQQVLRGRVGRRAATRFSGRLPVEQQLYEAAQARAPEGSPIGDPFLEWLVRKYPVLSKAIGGATSPNELTLEQLQRLSDLGVTSTGTP